MSIQSDMALMAAGSYWDVRGTDQTALTESNRAPLPEGWVVVPGYEPSGSGANAGSGFSARVYQNVASREIVISFAGTEFSFDSIAGIPWPSDGLLADFFTGNSAANVLTGGAGNDTYVVGTGDTTVEAANGGTDTVQSSITWTLATNVENLTLTGTGAINGTGNTLNNLLVGNSGANTLNGGAGNDTLDGGAGADSLVGGTGNDTYWLGRGYGIDTITENDATAGNTDVALFQAGIAVDQLWFAQSGNNLNVSIIGTNDRFTLTNWYLGGQYRVEQFQTSDGKRLLDAQVQNLVSAMAAFAPPPVGQTSLSSSQAASLSPVIAANWQ